MKLADYVALFLKNLGIEVVFGVTGGAVAHLFDSIAQYGIRPMFSHHEQAASFAAGAYARLRGIGCSMVTTGPGGTNAITGIAAAWLDSIPVIYLAGQVRFAQMKSPAIRQAGAQELDVVSIVTPITKYAKTLQDSKNIRYELEKATYISKSGRPGPVYLEIPLDFQWADIDPGALESFIPEVTSYTANPHPLLEDLFSARRPLLLLGQGLRLSGAEKLLDAFLQKTGMPYVTTWNAADLVDGYDPLNLGRPGMFGNRAANLAIQACDFLCCLASHLPSAVTTTDYKNFAKHAHVAVINIDPDELQYQRVGIAHQLCLDIGHFLQKALDYDVVDIEEWKRHCKKIQACAQEEVSSSSAPIDAYVAVRALNALLHASDTIVIDGGGTIVQIAFQTLKLQKGQRLLIDAGLCAMGSGLPHAIGAAVARDGNVICLCGDGSFQFNVHELQTIAYHQLPVKLFIFNNDGYLSIRHTQGAFLGGRYIGSEAKGGISMPSVEDVACAYKIPSYRIDHINDLSATVKTALQQPGPVICEILVPSNQDIRPKIGFDEIGKGYFMPRPMEDMHPYLPREILADLVLGCLS